MKVKMGIAMKACWLAPVLAASLIACATPYEGSFLGGGTSSSWISSDIFTVSAGGNAYTSQGDIFEYTMLRAAEETLAGGFEYFTMIDSLNTGKTEGFVYENPAISGVYHSRSISKPGARSVFAVANVIPEGAPPGQWVDALSAYNLLGSKYLKNFNPLNDPKAFSSTR